MLVRNVIVNCCYFFCLTYRGAEGLILGLGLGVDLSLLDVVFLGL